MVGLLDRVLEKGLYLDADLVITLADVPLVALKLKAFLAGMETMERYGLLGPSDALRPVAGGGPGVHKGGWADVSAQTSRPRDAGFP